MSLIFLATALASIVLLNLFVFFFHERLIFQGANIPKNHRFIFRKPFEEHFIESGDSGHINLLHFPVSKPLGAILYFHGNRGDLRKWGDIASGFTEYGYDVFVWDYRGYGKSTGRRTEELLYRDASEVSGFIDAQFQYSKLILFGRSLGSAMAIELASTKSPDLLILETPISNISNGIHKYRWIMPKEIIPRYRFDNLSKVPSLNCETVIFHGTHDYVVPLQFARQLFDAISVESKKIVIIPKGGHNNLNNFEIYHQTLKSTLTNYESIPET